MDREFIEEKIKELQSDNKLCFKQTSEIIELVYLKALKDLESISKENKDNLKIQEKNTVTSLNKFTDSITNSKLIKQYNNALKKIKELENELDKLNKQHKSPNAEFIENIDDVLLNEKLNAYNEIFDMFCYDNKDYLAIYDALKDKIYKTKEKIERHKCH